MVASLRRARVYLVGIPLAVMAGCAPVARAPVTRPPIADTSLELNGFPLVLHVAPGLAGLRGRLLVYATGDGGWRGKDRDVFRHLAAWGYQGVGFSAPDYLKHLPGSDGTATPAHIGNDYSRIVARAREALGLGSDVGVTLVGVSRGADLAVVAAGQPAVRDELDGVVVMGLTREEEYVRRRRATSALELYPYLSRLGLVPLSVIQSTRDTYLPAADARTLFGPDEPRRVLHAIEARNHSFGGARDRLYESLHESLDWVGELRSEAGGGS